MRIPLSLFDALTGLSDALRGETRSYENGVLGGVSSAVQALTAPGDSIKTEAVGPC